MLAYSIPESAIERTVTEISESMYSGNLRIKRLERETRNAIRFTITVYDSRAPGGRISHTGRRVAAACWHAHRDVLQRLFDHFPDARIRTAVADYRGKSGFEQDFPATADNNIGSMFQPMCYADACDCER